MIGRRYKHLKRGGKYEVVGRAKMQISRELLEKLLPCVDADHLGCIRDALEKISFVSYKTLDEDESLFFRPESEFLDGRFKDVTPVRIWVLCKRDPSNGHPWKKYYNDGRNGDNKGWRNNIKDASPYTERDFAHRDLSNAFPMSERVKIRAIETEIEPE